MDSILESLGAHQFVNDSTTATDGVGGGERLATTAAYSMETPGAMARAVESLEAGARATDVMPESRAQRPTASEEQAAHPEMPRGMVGCFVRPPSTQGEHRSLRERHQLWRRRSRRRRRIMTLS